MGRLKASNFKTMPSQLDGLRTFFDFDFDFSKLALRASFSPFFAEVDFQYASKSNFFSTSKLFSIQLIEKCKFQYACDFMSK
jgi:hypothetical protein